MKEWSATPPRLIHLSRTRQVALSYYRTPEYIYRCAVPGAVLRSIILYFKLTLLR